MGKTGDFTHPAPSSKTYGSIPGPYFRQPKQKTSFSYASLLSEDN